MKHTKLIVALGAVFAASAAMALPDEFKTNPTGATTESDLTRGVKHIAATVENEGVHSGKAAIWVDDINAKTDNKNGLANNKHVSFAKIDDTANRFFVKVFAKDILGKDRNGVTVAQLYRMKGIIWDNIPKMPDHSHLGRLSYAKAGNHDVYFGDWASVPSGANANTPGTNYTVFYSGTGKTTNLPSSGKATYAVKGINNHVKQGTAVLTGNLAADFGSKKLNGTIARPGLSVAINAGIDTKQASFAGAAKANNRIEGTTKGHFFGNQGAALAGVADFGKNNPHNTAFGGTKK